MIIHLRNGGTSVVLDTDHAGPPIWVHWGEDLGDQDDDALQALALAVRPQAVSGGLDAPARLSVLPQEAFGWQNTPAIVGSRPGGRHFSPSLAVSSVTVDGARLTLTAQDPQASLALTLQITLDDHGILSQRLALTNEGTEAYTLDALGATFPLPDTAAEILDTTGRHLRERTPQRHTFTIGSHVRESRRGRPGADSTLLLTAGTPGFGFERGLVHGVHLAWSGNHRLTAERTPAGHALINAGELLLSGEVILAPGETYTTPEVLGSWGDGLTELSARFHSRLRARTGHPRGPRPVTLNTWEAVYFDHDLGVLREMAEAAAAVGVERFVLDDGWFRGRHDDTAGLGDWYVDETVWPEGLAPLVDTVTGLGMQFGLWVEPEMVNADSDLFRAHPDWILQPSARLPVTGRRQQVLDLSHPDAYAYLLERLDALVTEYRPGYLKWDHNRDLMEPGSTVTGTAAVHDGVLALYRLLDELRARHPGLEIESCASGGSRVDLGILEHTDRIWTSDCNDPLERLTIAKYTTMVVPYELMGAHIGGPVSHTTGRRHTLAFRAGVALFGHLGIEWDIRSLSGDETAELSAWVAAYKTHRELLHTGRAVFADLGDDTADLRGVVAPDRAAALYAFTQVTSAATHPPRRLRLPGLDDTRRYRVTIAAPTTLAGEPGESPLPWAGAEIVLTGLALRVTGVQAPVLFPEHLTLISVAAVGVHP